MATAESAASVASLAAGTKPPLRFGLLAFIGAGASMLVCYGKALLLIPLSIVLGNELHFNPHLQAVLMWALGGMALYGLIQDRKVHGVSYPAYIGAVGVLTIIITLYGYYQGSIELAGYILLMIAAFTNQIMILNHLNRQVQAKTRQVEDLNAGLEERVQEQIDEIERLARLKRFLSPEVANLITAQQEKSMLQSHRSYIATVYCDLRGFTTFSARMEPEEVMHVLQAYHEKLGQLVADYRGTIDHRAGDGMMVFFNDPLPCDNPVLEAAGLAVSMRKCFADMNRGWQKRGYELGFGVGIASGYATLGVIGYQGRYDYTANGNAVNLSARLCDEARDGQILINHKTYIEIEEHVDVEPVGELELKGFNSKTRAYNLIGLRD